MRSFGARLRALVGESRRSTHQRAQIFRCLGSVRGTFTQRLLSIFTIDASAKIVERTTLSRLGFGEKLGDDDLRQENRAPVNIRGSPAIISKNGAERAGTVAPLVERCDRQSPARTRILAFEREYQHPR